MAKFTKLNIGDTVASGGGRVFKKLSVESAVVEDELQGAWVLNDTITQFSYEFTAGPIEAKAFSYDRSISRASGKYIGVVGGGGRVRIFSTSSGGEIYPYFLTHTSVDFWKWQTASANASYNRTGAPTLVIYSKLSEVNNGEALLSWLKQNATKESGIVLTFTIDGTSYQAEAGMTWREWCESEYNTDGYEAGDNYVTFDIHNYYVTNVSPNDTIEDNRAYTLTFFGTGGGGSN